MTETWSRGEALISAHCERGVLTLDFAGRITPKVIAFFCVRVRPELEELGPAYAILLRADRAQIEISAATMTVPVRHDDSQRGLQLPGAVYCRPEHLELFREHGRTVAPYGLLRVPFTDLAQAETWALARVESARQAAMLKTASALARWRSSARHRPHAAAVHR